ncbi:hypothetical protein [Helicobacter japonicus]|uniref:hypothetical protein n=1 Tax=Helicobacter japonicus TaxID=425400 RepID=UPI0023550BDB|nr:hypothetical protein [Helicobacter japonicus]
MKVIFVNAPHIKNPNANAVNNFTVTTSLLDKLRTPHTYKNMLGGGECIIISLAFFLVSIMAHVMA